MLGRYVPLPPGPAIWWRCALALGLLYGFCRWRGLDLRLPAGHRGRLILFSGVLMAFHWVTYFYALQLAGVAIGMLAVFTYPAITTLLAPLMIGERLRGTHVGLAVLVLIGVYFLVPGEMDLADDGFVGLLCGLLSAAIYSVRNVLMKQEIARTDGTVLMVWQVVVSVVVLSPFLLQYPRLPTAAAWPYLIGLAVLVTAIGHSLFLRSFAYFPITTASLLSCIQPIYGILLTLVFFREVPAASSLRGGALILVAVVGETLRVGAARRRK